MNKLSFYVCKILPQYPTEEVEKAIKTIRNGEYVHYKVLTKLVSEYLNKQIPTVLEVKDINMSREMEVRIGVILSKPKQYDAHFYDYFEYLHDRYPCFGYEPEYNK